MLIKEIIANKRDGKKLSSEEIIFFIDRITKNQIPESQISALLMAIVIKGMNLQETITLTEAMVKSGQIIDWQGINNPIVDKHSTGGIGDKVSLILVPWCSTLGLNVPMLSGRSLGHTGGTLDKLESINGFKTNLSIQEIIDGIKKVGAVITGQTESIAPIFY